MLVYCKHEETKERFLKALGLESSLQQPQWPLPNLEKTSYKRFWVARSQHSFPAEAWADRIKINGQWATLLIYFDDFMSGKNSGYAVLVYYTHYIEKARTEFYRWSACDHDFQREEYRNCYEKLKCEKCGEAYEVYSD